MTKNCQKKCYTKHGDEMKKTILTALFAFFLGITLSILTVYNLKDKLNLTNQPFSVTAFQVGVYKSKENADKIKEQYPSSIVVQDEDYYRVYVGVSAGDDWTHSLEKYFLENNVNVYPKEIQVTNTFYEELNQYKTLFSNSDASVYERLNGEIMKKIEGEIL